MSVRGGVGRVAGRGLATVGIAVAMVFPGAAVAVASGPTQPGSATLAASSTQITYGGFVRLTGGIQSSDQDCMAGRQVELQAQHPGEVAWTAVVAKSTAADGTFSF